MDSSRDIIEKELKKIKPNRLHGRKIMLMGRIEHVCMIASILTTNGAVYGTGSACSTDFTIEAILDNDKNKQGLYAENLPILSPEEALCPFRNDVFIIIYSPKYWEDMCAQLAEYGYVGDSYVYVLDKPGFYKNILLLKKGLCIYRKLRRKYGDDVNVFLTNCPLGDFYLLGLYFHQYCEQNRIDNYVVAGTSRGIEKLSLLFHLKATKRLTTEESNALIRAWIFWGPGVIRITPLTIWQGAFRFNPCITRQKNGLCFLDTFTKMIFSLSNPLPRYPVFPENTEKVKKIFETNGLQKNKTVILSPFSYSLQSLPDEFWIQVAKILKEKGYSVAINVDGEREHNFISDTVTLHMDFAEIMAAMELAGTVIGMRSGFFDITARAKCTRIVLYPPTVQKNMVWNSTDIGFCSLKVMGLCDDAHEWEVRDMEEICKRIMTVL